MSPPTSSLFIGKPTYIFDELDSTNNYATELLSKSNPSEGTVIKACFQTAGRGQIGRSWKSEPNKNLLCSIILYPKFLLAHEQFLLNMAISIGICDAVQAFVSEEIFIKWPNDIYIGKRKVGGILIQSNLNGQKIQSCIVGIGLNINQLTFSDSLPNPISLALLIGHTINQVEFEQNLYRVLEFSYLKLKRGEHGDIKRRYIEKLFWKDKVRSFSDEKGNIFTGIIKGIDPLGKLIVEREEGTHSYPFRSIKFLL